MAPNPGCAVGRHLLALVLLAPAALAALSGSAFTTAVPVVLTQRTPLLFEVAVYPRPIPGVVHRVSLELVSSLRGRTGFNVTLYDDGARNATTGALTTFITVPSAWLAATSFGAGERAYVLASAYDAADSTRLAPGSPYQVVESNRVTIAAAAGGSPSGGAQFVADCGVRQGGRGQRALVLVYS